MLHDFVVRTWTKADGLPDDSVTTLCKLATRYLWIGTGSGLVSFRRCEIHTGSAFSGKLSKKTVSITALSEDKASIVDRFSDQGLFCRLPHQSGNIKNRTALL